jgi:hypothetical protein
MRKMMIVGLVLLGSSSALLISFGSQSLIPRPDPLSKRQMAISIAAADERVPSPKIIDKLEITLSGNRCVRNIELWNRRYAFGLDDNHVLNTHKIAFSLKRVGSTTPPGREIVTYRLFPELDDSQFDRVDGYYLFPSGRVIVTYCGPNRS